MVDCKIVYETCLARGINFFAGVPDSLLQDFCSYTAEHAAAGSHFVAANEGGAVALAAGFYLATGRPALVYMQNSGQGNAANPLISLADPDVYGIPMILVIGWRGEPGIHDEPQHLKQGKITFSLLQTMGIPCACLPDDASGAVAALNTMIDRAVKDSCPAAIIVKKGSFEKYRSAHIYASPYPVSRESAIGKILHALPHNAVVVSTTGQISRELYELRIAREEGHDKDFLTVGSMGHASQIALGIAVSRPNRDVFCLDGDGAVLMHMGSLAITGQSGLGNFKHIVLNNGAHDSVGGQPTVGFAVDFPAIAKACGYRYADSACSADMIDSAVLQLQDARGPAFLEIKVASGARKDLGRPQTTPSENKIEFMKQLGAEAE